MPAYMAICLGACLSICLSVCKSVWLSSLLEITFVVQLERPYTSFLIGDPNPVANAALAFASDGAAVNIFTQSRCNCLTDWGCAVDQVCVCLVIADTGACHLVWIAGSWACDAQWRESWS